MGEHQDELIMLPLSEYERLMDIAAHHFILYEMGVEEWGGYVTSSRDCVGCSKHYGWSLTECPVCFVDLPTPEDLK